MTEIDLVLASCISGAIGFYFGMVFTCWYFGRDRK